MHGLSTFDVAIIGLVSESASNIHFIYGIVAVLAEVMESNWPILLEEVGLFIPTEFINKEHDDKPEGIDELGNSPFPFPC